LSFITGLLVMLPTALAGLLVARDDAAQSANVSNAVNYITGLFGQSYIFREKFITKRGKSL
jgi:uncharacterized membrane protein YdcZ (DUF606 family)